MAEEREITASFWGAVVLEESYYEKAEEQLVYSEKQLEKDKCNFGCQIKNGYFYCKATGERCPNGLFDKPWDRRKNQ